MVWLTASRRNIKFHFFVYILQQLNWELKLDENNFYYLFLAQQAIQSHQKLVECCLTYK